MITSDITMNPVISRLSRSQGLGTGKTGDSQKTEQSPRVLGIESDLVFTDIRNFDSQASSANRNALAKDIRAADKSMERLEKISEELKTQLERIVKNYPPFPPGSEERVKLLRSFNSFRKEIEQLTIPPTEELVKEIILDPGSLSNESDGDPNITIGAPGMASQDGQSAQAYTERFHIAELPEDATDEEINEMIDNLDAAIKKLVRKRSELYEAVIESTKNPEDEDAYTTAKTHDWGTELMAGSTKSLTRAQSQLAHFL